MSQHYSNPKREKEPYALPDVETFKVGVWTPVDECPACQLAGEEWRDHDEEQNNREGHTNEHYGWYYWFCFPGCTPDSDANGPFETEEEALADAREGMDDDE